MTDSFSQARELFQRGLAALEAGRLDDAEAAFEASLRHLPGRVSTLVNLAATRLRLGRPAAALALLDDALAAQPDDADTRYQRAMALTTLQRHAEALADLERLLAAAPEHAGAWFRHGQALEHLDRRVDALASYDKALALDPGHAQAWTMRANVLKDIGRTEEAVAAYRRALAAGGDAALNGYYLAALTGEQAPSAPPRRYVEHLFDDYADTFDAHLVGALGYRAHHVLVEHLQGVRPVRVHSALDLGCGTGLCGPLVKALADRVDGVDLSATMLDKARALGVYGHLVQADVAEHLAHTDRRYDLVLAADVFIYVGALEAVFEGVRRVLERGGVFCFSVEEAPRGVDFELRASLRYAHSEAYVRRLATQSGFELVKVERQPIREDQRRPIEGLYVYLRRP